METREFGKVRFPAIRSVEISGYALFPGTDGTGLSHQFGNGVSVIAGINGLGKTTLLNALLRVLIGPSDVLRENPTDVGSTSHQLISWRSPGYFANRVPDAAVSATIAVRVSFGTEWIYLVRRLRDLGIEQLRHNDSALSPTEETYQRLVCSLSGLDTFYDFHFLVRNLVFYLEDRRPLIWTDDGQFEIARILFIPGTEATAFSQLYDEIKSADSRYRNLLTESNRMVRRLNEQKRAENAQQSNLAAIASLKDTYAGAQAALESTEANLESAIEQERQTSEELRRAQLDLEGSFRDYEGIQQDFFARAFPEASETLHYVYAHLISDGGCIVCGSAAPEKAEEIRALMADGSCPVCESVPARQERFVARSDVAAERVNRAARHLQAQRLSLEGLADRRQKLVAQVQECLGDRRSILEQIGNLQARLAAFGARLPASGSATTELEVSVKVSQENLEALQKTRNEAVGRFRRMMAAASERIVGAHSTVQHYFRTYVRHFLAETCELNLRNRRRPIGESGQAVDFPGFDVLMTSGVFRDQPRPRETREDISESQKEFIDLAFRMALMRAATREDEGAMLVLETPESSLDSLFVYRAGALLRQFAEEGGELGNMLIASSNLNDANMIPALLGIDSDPALAKDVPGRVINLLDLAAPNAAMLTQGDAYRRQFQKATTSHPERLPEQVLE